MRIANAFLLKMQLTNILNCLEGLIQVTDAQILNSFFGGSSFIKLAKKYED